MVVFTFGHRRSSTITRIEVFVATKVQPLRDKAVQVPRSRDLLPPQTLLQSLYQKPQSPIQNCCSQQLVTTWLFSNNLHLIFDLRRSLPGTSARSRARAG